MPAQAATDGELFWFITQGDVNNGMPSWAAFPEERRWQIVSYVKAGMPAIPRPPIRPTWMPPLRALLAPKGPFTDFRFEAPGKIRKISVQDLPAPFTTASAGNAPKLVDRPQNAWPKAPAGFKVDQYATGLDGPRLIRTAPNGDYFVAESMAGDIKVFRGIGADSKPAAGTGFCQRPQPPLWHCLLSARAPIRNGFTSETRTPSCAFPTIMAI